MTAKDHSSSALDLSPVRSMRALFDKHGKACGICPTTVIRDTLRGMYWHEQTWPAIQQMNKQLPVVVPLGSLEQHGHHLPLFVDSIQVTEIAQRVERALTKGVLLLPTQWLGSSHHHMDFPGTVSVLPGLYAQVIKSIAKSILNAGFRRIFFLNGHGGNEVPGA